MELKEGIKVVFTGEIKGLEKETIGIIGKLHEDWCVIIYPQNSAYEDNGKGGWKPIKGKPEQVYAHSSKLTEIKCAVAGF